VGCGFLTATPFRRLVKISEGGAFVEVIPVAPRFASQSATSLPKISAWPGTQWKWTAVRSSSDRSRSLTRVMSLLLLRAIHRPLAILIVYILSMKK
jgi:hypothetical protein